MAMASNISHQIFILHSPSAQMHKGTIAEVQNIHNSIVPLSSSLKSPFNFTGIQWKTSFTCQVSGSKETYKFVLKCALVETEAL